MENFKNKKNTTPQITPVVDDVLIIDYAIDSISIENESDDIAALVYIHDGSAIDDMPGFLVILAALPKNLQPGKNLNFFAGENGRYKPGTWVIDARGTSVVITLNK